MTLPRRPAPSIVALVHDVVDGAPIAREAAVARLAIAGARAEGVVIQALITAEPRARAALLGVLERWTTARALSAGIDCLAAADTTVATAAVAAVRPHLLSEDPDLAARALDALVSTSLDTGRAEAARLAAIDAIAGAGGGAEDVLARLRDDPSDRIRRAVAGGPDSARVAGAAQIEAVAADPGRDPLAVQRLIGEVGAQGSLSALHQLVLALAHAERTAATDGERAGWTGALGAAHAALAARGSRLARQDLRDALERTPPDRLGELVGAAEAIGDAGCLAPLAAAWTGAEEATRARVATAFAAIVAREGLGRRHAAVKDVLTRWPHAATELLRRTS
ncbi:MAG: hypothetical protein ABIT71_02040 [Vicinamibacteraceae bacterium]